MSDTPRTAPSVPLTEEIDLELGRADLVRLTPRIEAVPRDKAILPRLDIRVASLFAAGVGQMILEPSLYRRFASLPAEEFDIRHVDDLLPLARATFYARREQSTARATASTAKLPVDLVDEATEVKERMLKVSSYHFEGTPEEDEVDDIRQGTGYLDLLSDLGRLARLYEKYPEVVTRDSKHYRPGDLVLARRLALRISDELGESTTADEERRTLVVARLWVLLDEVYEEVALAGRWLFRRADGERKFQSLYAVARSRGGRRRKRRASGEGGASGGGA